MYPRVLLKIIQPWLSVWRQAIIWTNADPIHWCIYAALRGGGGGGGGWVKYDKVSPKLRFDFHRWYLDSTSNWNPGVATGIHVLWYKTNIAFMRYIWYLPKTSRFQWYPARIYRCDENIYLGGMVLCPTECDRLINAANINSRIMSKLARDVHIDIEQFRKSYTSGGGHAQCVSLYRQWHIGQISTRVGHGRCRHLTVTFYFALLRVIFTKRTYEIHTKFTWKIEMWFHV